MFVKKGGIAGKVSEREREGGYHPVLCNVGVARPGMGPVRLSCESLWENHSNSEWVLELVEQDNRHMCYIWY